jgi:hypothetical protein
MMRGEERMGPELKEMKDLVDKTFIEFKDAMVTLK